MNPLSTQWEYVESEIKCSILESKNTFLADNELSMEATKMCVARGILHYKLGNYHECVNRVCFLRERWIKSYPKHVADRVCFLREGWIKSNKYCDDKKFILSRNSSYHEKELQNKELLNKEVAEFCFKYVGFSGLNQIETPKSLKFAFEAQLVSNNKDLKNSFPELFKRKKDVFYLVAKGKTFLDCGLWDESIINFHKALDLCLGNNFYQLKTFPLIEFDMFFTGNCYRNRAAHEQFSLDENNALYYKDAVFEVLNHLVWLP